MKRILTVDPGTVSGVAIGHVVPATGTLLDLQTFEVPGGVAGLADVLDGWVKADLVVVEDFIIGPSTYRKSREGVMDALDGRGHTLALAHLWDAKLEVIAPDGHKTFNRAVPKGKVSKVRMLNLAPATPDGHAEDAASLFLVGVKRNYPKVMGDILGRVS